MYSNSKEQINLESVYRSVHVEKLQQEEGDLSQTSDNSEQNYKSISDTFLKDPTFSDKVLKYWVGPAVDVAVKNMSKTNPNMGSQFKNEADKQRLAKELLMDDEVLIVLDKLHKMDKDHQHNTPQYINYQRNLAHKIEDNLKKQESHNVLSTFRKQTSFD